MLKIRRPVKNGGIADKLLTAMSQGWQNSITIENDVNWQWGDERNAPQAFFGLGDMNFPKAYHLKQKQLPFILIDMPYWRRRGPNVSFKEALWRICINGIHVNRVIPGLDDKRSPGWGYKSWKTGEGNYLLVAESSNSVNRWCEVPFWNDDIRKEIREHTPFPVKYRIKPRIGKQSGPEYAGIPLETDFKNAHAVITTCSIVGVEAILNGIPVICDQLSAANPVSRNSVSQVDHLLRGDRLEWFRTLQYHQYTCDEIANGTAYYTLRDIYGKDFPELF